MIEGNSPLSCDVAIIGAGPAGSALAIHLARAGRSVVIIEKQAFPRFHIGEALTGECIALLDELGMTDYLDNANFTTRRGVTVSGANSNAKFWVGVEGVREDGTRFPTTSFHVRREEFDTAMLEKALAEGAVHLQASCNDVLFTDGHVSGLSLRGADGTNSILHTRAVADCSGQKTFLASKGIIGPKTRTGFENQSAIFAQMTGVTRDPPPKETSTHIFYGHKHHWAWAIPLTDTVTSVGIVLPKSTVERGQGDLRDMFTAALGKVNADFQERTADAQLVSGVHTASNYSYSIDNFTGPGYLCVGDSHRFLDPIFSFGVLIALQEAKLAAATLGSYLENREDLSVFAEYEAVSMRAQRIVEYIIRTFWEFPLAFLKLAHYSHQSDIAELFSGRLYSPEVEQIEAVGLMRDLLTKSNKIAA